MSSTNRMQNGYILFFFIFPISLEGCCVERHQKKRTGLQQNITHRYYRAVEGEIFMLPCLKYENRHVEMVCVKTGGGREGNERTSFDCGRKFRAEAKHSGNYTCLPRPHVTELQVSSVKWQHVVHLQVVEKNSLGCFQPKESNATLRVGQGGNVSCPGLNCSDNTNVIWYKCNRTVSEQSRSSCETNGLLHLCQVDELDTGLYFCDRQIIQQGVHWTFRMSVYVTVVPQTLSSDPPTIKYPNVNTTEEVELGQSHTLTCKVYFPFEKKLSRKVQWYMHYGGNMDNITRLHLQLSHQEGEKFQGLNVIQRAIIKQVTPQHLSNSYTCFASNTFGNSSVTIQLRKKIGVRWPSLVRCPIASLLVVAGLGIVLYVKRLDLQLIYRSRFQHGNYNGDEKEFDVLLSYVWSPPSAEEGVLTLSSRSRPDTYEEECLSSSDLLNSEGKTTPRPLEVLLPQVLEDRWGYRLCLLERDVLPGGAYTNDVALAIQRSQMLICLLSADYLSDSSAVFVLESGVQALLKNSTPKLLLIWTSRASASLIQPDPPLPKLVRRALKVLPSLDWTSDQPARATSNFWKCLMKAMPDHTVKLVSLTQH